MTKYELKDFKNWIEKNSSNNISSWNWNHKFSYFEPTTRTEYYGRPPVIVPPQENFEAIAQGKPKMSWNSTELAVIKRWISEVDEK